MRRQLIRVDFALARRATAAHIAKVKARWR
jgi:hypothetical protein